MQTSNLYIAGIGAHVADRVSAEDAVTRGAYDLDLAASSGVESVGVATTQSAPELAVVAAKQALAMAGPDAAAQTRMVLHTYLNFQGAHHWDAAPYVALHTVGADVPGLDVRQSCNGGLGCVELAAYLLADGVGSVLVTAADRFDNVGFDRWNCDPRAVFGDGAAAVLLSGHDGFARVTAVTTGADNTLEAESRGAAFTRGGHEDVDFQALRERYMAATMPYREHMQRVKAVLTTTLEQVLAEADTTREEIAYAVPVVPTYPGLLGLFRQILHIDEAKSTWYYGRTTGHLGAADNLAGLHHLITSGAVRPGHKILLVGGGTGYTCTLAVVEILKDPS